MTQLILALACLFIAGVIYNEFLARSKVQTVKIAGNGSRACELAEGIINVLVEQVEQRRGPIIGAVGEDGKTITLHTFIEAVDGRRLILRDRLTPGTLVTVIR